MEEGPTQTFYQHSLGGADGLEERFILRKLGRHPSKNQVQVDFTPKTHPKSEGSREVPLSTIPTFNRDSKHYTPSFMLEVDKHKLTQNDLHYLAQHVRKMDDLSHEKSEMFLAQPSKFNRFCCICRQPFQDYLTHVNMPSHQKLLQQSWFSESILELCQRVNPPNQIPIQPQPTNPTKKTKKIAKKAPKPKKDKQILEVSTSNPTENEKILHG